MLKEIIKSSTKAYVTCGEAAIGILDAFLKAVLLLLQPRTGIRFEWKDGWDWRSVKARYCW